MTDTAHYPTAGEEPTMTDTDTKTCHGHYADRPTKHDDDRMADLIWWLKGALETKAFGIGGVDEFSLNSGHIEALRKHRTYASYDADGNHAR